jgi:ribonucleoside-diphosphate reductase alpha chain
MVELAPISQRIWTMKYRLKDDAGRPLEESIAQTWQRVARALAAVEPPDRRETWRARFEAALQDFRFMPAGRILAGAGVERDLTLFNCFVMGTIPDDMGGIFAHLREAALTMQQGGGIGYDFSTIRPKGAPVRGVGADASGPVSFMDVWDSMCRTIMSAGSRRGAMMGTLRCDHPDIEAFVAAKQDPDRLRMFNVSVLVTDAFMDAVDADRDWPLVFDGETYRTLRARDLWHQIMRATYDYAEPGVIFIDRINQNNNLWYCEEINATNPCVTADTWIQTGQGPRQVRELVGVPFDACVQGATFASTADGFFATGEKPVYRLTTQEGFELRLTAAHPVRRVQRRTRHRLDTAWTPAGELRAGDEVVLNARDEGADWPGPNSEAEGYLIGLLIGDGTLKADKAVLAVWTDLTHAAAGPAAVMHEAETAARTLRHRADFAGWTKVGGRNEHRMVLAALHDLAVTLGLSPGHKPVTPAIEANSAAFYRGFLRGLFDADGTVVGTQAKGVSVRLPQSDLQRLKAVQRMLLRLGVMSRIHTERRPAGPRTLPDGAGDVAAYACSADHELIISNDSLGRFAERIGFGDSDKHARLTAALAAYARRPNRDRFVARVASVDADGHEPVFDASIPGRHAFDANGFEIHNCGEQPLPPYGACLLGSINLAQLVERPFTPEARLDTDALAEVVPVAVRMLDNAIDASGFPLEAQRREAEAKRRIGLGVTGLADALVMCGHTYGSADAVAVTESWMAALRDHAYRASVDLAEARGAFPLFDADKYLQGTMIRELDDDLRQRIAASGIRNALVTSVAPTGTISLLANNVSSGLEPVYSRRYTRNVLEPDGSRSREEVRDYALDVLRAVNGPQAVLPESFVDVGDLTPSAHVAMQAAVQRHVDASVSKTINVPADIPFDSFKDVYRQAYDLGCKGCTTYRPNPVTGAVLETDGAADRQRGTALEPARRAEMTAMTEPLERPEVLPGRTYKLVWPGSDHAIYITLNDTVVDGQRRPFEIFINSKNMEHYAWTVALTRMISAVFRRGGDVSFVVEELKAVFDPRGGAWHQGRYKPSLLAAIGEVIEQHMIDIGFRAPGAAKAAPAPSHAPAPSPTATGPPAPRQCPSCGTAAVIAQEGCDLCTHCGYSRCL